MKKYLYIVEYSEDYDTDYVEYSADFCKKYSAITVPKNIDVVVDFDSEEEFAELLAKHYFDMVCYDTMEECKKMSRSKVNEMIHPVYYHPYIGEIRPKVLDF